nr:hypothetical protein [Tanacetum cinerariifolium]
MVAGAQAAILKFHDQNLVILQYSIRVCDPSWLSLPSIAALLVDFLSETRIPPSGSKPTYTLRVVLMRVAGAQAAIHKFHDQN